MEDLSLFKLNNRRRNRPLWAKDDRSLMLRVIGPSAVRRWTIARMYWRENKTAREIAKHFQTTVGSIERTIYLVRHTD